jgi:hypothetical protein
MGVSTTAVAAAGTTIIPVAATPAIITALTTVHRIPMTRTRMTAGEVIVAAEGEAEGIEANQGSRIRRGGVSLRMVHAGDWGFTETKR